MAKKVEDKATIPLKDRYDIHDAYLEGLPSLRQIHNFMFPQYTIREIRHVLNSFVDTRRLIKRRKFNAKHLLDSDAYEAYQDLASLRGAAKRLNVSPATVRKHVLRYQETHPEADVLILEKKAQTDE